MRACGTCSRRSRSKSVKERVCALRRSTTRVVPGVVGVRVSRRECALSGEVVWYLES